MSIVAAVRSRAARVSALDAGLALACAVVGLAGTTVAAHGQDESLGVAAYACLAIGPAALLGRRRAPRTVLGIVLGSILAFRLLDTPEGPFWFPLLIAFAGTVMAGHRAFAWLILVGGYGALVWLPPALGRDDAPSAVSAMAVAAWLLVLITGSEIARAQRERAIERRRAAAEEERRRAGEERMRIARELHDVLAHNISLINVQAGVALHLLEQRPEQARPALTAIKQASKETLAELRSVLELLRQSDDDAAPRQPASGLDRLDELVAGARAAGLTVDCRVEGERRALPAGVDLAAYRIVQESLTNVRRHAGPARATVVVHYGGEELRVQIDDDGGATRVNGHEDIGTGSGNGIAGMRERAGALGGVLEAGPRAEGGFRVLARLPIDAELVAQS